MMVEEDEMRVNEEMILIEKLERRKKEADARIQAD